MKTVVLNCFLLLVCYYQASTQSFEFNGIIYGSESKNPVANVNIKIAGESIGTTSDELGNFNIIIDKIPCTLILSHISYEKQYMKLNTIETKLRSIILHHKTYTLNEINISDKKVEELLKKTKFFVYDFIIFENRLLLIVFDEKNFSKTKLVLLDLQGEIITTKSIKKPEKLYKDCLGTCHLISNDTAYQIYFDNSKLQLIYPVGFNEFEELMYPCLAELNNKIYFKKYYYNDQILSYYYIDKITNAYREISYISDKVGLTILNDLERHINTRKNVYTEADARFDKMCFFNPIHAPLLKIDSNILIFNYISSVIEFYSKNGNYLKEVSIDYHKTTQWQEKIYIDDYTNEIYTTFRRNNGIITLAKIEISSGKVITKYKISQFAYLFKVLVFKNNAYFLYSDRSNTELRKLYKMYMAD